MKIKIKSFDGAEMNGADITPYVKSIDFPEPDTDTIPLYDHVEGWKSVPVNFSFAQPLPPPIILPMPRGLVNPFGASIGLDSDGRMDFDDCFITDNVTGERWKLRNGEWLPTWPRRAAATRKPQGQARYMRRCANGNRDN